jgi:hypothetical protein
MRFCVVTPFASPVLMTAFIKTISVVMSSSLLSEKRDQLALDEAQARSNSRSCLLLDRRTDTDWWYRDVLPQELLWPSDARVESQELTVGRGDLLEEGEDLEGVEVVHRLLNVRLDLLGLVHRLGEALPPRLVRSLALPSLAVVRLLRPVPSAELLVTDAHGSNLLNNAVDVTAVGADGALARLGRELAREGGDGEGVEVGSTEEGEEATVLGRVEKDARTGLWCRKARVSGLQRSDSAGFRRRPITPLKPPTHLADALEDVQTVAKVSNVEDGEDELDVGVVTDTIGERKAASLASSTLVAGTEAAVEHSVQNGRPVLYLVQVTLVGLELGDGDNFLGGEDGELDVLAMNGERGLARVSNRSSCTGLLLRYLWYILQRTEHPPNTRERRFSR